MKVTSLRVKNFTSMLEVALFDLSAFVVLIGKNSSGKSNLIDALTLLFLDFGDELERNMGDPANWEHLFHNHNTQISEPIEIAVSMLSHQESGRNSSIWMLQVSLHSGNSHSVSGS